MSERNPTLPEDPMDAARQASEELKELKERLSTVTRHSLRTPLTVIDGNARRLGRHASKFSPDEVRERADIIRQTVEKMVELVEHSIELTQMATCVRDYPPVTRGLDEVIRKIVDEYDFENPETSLVAWMNECPDLLVADRRLIELILDKLLTLGLELVDRRGRLDLICWEEADWAVFSLKAVFEARALVDMKGLSGRLEADADSRSNLLDAGVTLNLIRLLIEQHGGELEIENAEDRIEFEIRLPIDSADNYPGGPLVRLTPNSNPVSQSGAKS